MIHHQNRLEPADIAPRHNGQVRKIVAVLTAGSNQGPFPAAMTKVLVELTFGAADDELSLAA